jgi:hypothetical protein
MNATTHAIRQTSKSVARGNARARHDSLMHVTVKTDRAQAVAARNIGKFSC